MSQDKLLASALEAYDAGICVMPPREDGSKRPISNDWKKWQKSRPARSVVERYFSRERHGLGIITGSVSLSIECLDFDAAGELYEPLKARAKETGLGDLVAKLDSGYLERTAGGGVHWIYRCSEISGNTKLARRPKRPEEQVNGGDKIQVLVETRGEGGYLVVAPSCGPVHSTKKPYVLVSGGWKTIPTITPEERSALFELARSFDSVETRKPTMDPSDSWDDAAERSRRVGNEPRVGDAFAAATSWREILEPHGWAFVFEKNGESFWRRPGKDKGISASTNMNGSDGLFVWSSSTPFEQEKAYGKFGAFAVLNHDGDFRAAAVSLAPRFGAPMARNPVTALGRSNDEDPIRLTDLGNARRLIRRHGKDLRYSSFLGWLVWDGTRWRSDNDGAVERLALDVPRELFVEASRLEAQSRAAQGDERERLEAMAEAFSKWGHTSEGERAQRRLIRLAQVLPGVPVHPDELDRDPWLLCCPNGTVDLRTGELQEPKREQLLTRLSGANFDPGASSPVWLSFLNKIMNGKPEPVEFLHRIAGYSLSGDTREQCFFLFHGKGANGKSTFIEVLRAVAGDYARVAQFSSFTAKQSEGIRSDLARLRGARLVSAIETKEGARLDEGLVKQITGGDPVTACFKYKDEFEFTPILKLILAANEKPEIRGSDLGIWRRVRLVPFEVTIPEAERDETLKEKILAELPGVLAWAVAGARAWLQSGLAETAEARAARDAYKDDQDELGPFLESECLVAQNAQVDSSSLYKAYSAWAESEGVYKVSTKVFAGRLESAGFKKTRRGQAHETRGRTSWIGLSLLPKGEDDVPERAYDEYQRGR